MSDRNCATQLKQDPNNQTFANIPGIGNLTECVPLNRCPTVLDNPLAPSNQTITCGFDSDSQLLMICCPEDLVTDPVVKFILLNILIQNFNLSELCPVSSVSHIVRRSSEGGGQVQPMWEVEV